MRKTLAENGFHDADVVKYEDPTGEHKWNYLVRVGAVSVVSEAQAKQIRESLAKVGEASCMRLEWAEGGDKLYLRYDRPVEPSVLQNSLKAIGVSADAGAALRPLRGQHLRSDARQPGQRDPPGSRHEAGRGCGVARSPRWNRWARRRAIS